MTDYFGILAEHLNDAEESKSHVVMGLLKATPFDIGDLEEAIDLFHDVAHELRAAYINELAGGLNKEGNAGPISQVRSAISEYEAEVVSYFVLRAF